MSTKTNKREMVPPQTDRRRTVRYPFVASAEISESVSATPVYARVTEIGLNGCFLEMRNPLPKGKQIFVKIFTRSEFFESSATIVYSQPNLGAGVAFNEANRHFVSTLHKWLLEGMNAAAQEKEQAGEAPPADTAPEQ